MRDTLSQSDGSISSIVSHHLKFLKYAGNVTDRKSDKWVNYSLADTKALDFLRVIEARYR